MDVVVTVSDSTLGIALRADTGCDSFLVVEGLGKQGRGVYRSFRWAAWRSWRTAAALW